MARDACGARAGMAAIEAVRAALGAERLRTARLFNRFRFLAVSAFFGLTVFMGLVLGRKDWANNDWVLFTAYWAVAGTSLWAGERSPAAARLTGLALPLIDMPAILALEWRPSTTRTRGSSSGRRPGSM